MRVLFHIEPLLFHGRPFHYAALFDFFFSLSGPLADVAYISNPALAQRAKERHGIASNRLFSIPESSLQDVTGRSSMDTLRALQCGSDPALLQRLANLYRETLGGFQPDVVITITPSPYWRVAFPEAVLLHVDGGLFSRDPLPHVFFLDSDGIFDTSAVAAYADSLKSLPATKADRTIVDLLRAEFRHRMLVNSPFRQLERDLRARFRRLLLLPLQFAGEFGFDLNCGYDRQGSYLFDVIQRVSRDTAVIVTEHPTAIWLGDTIDPETREYVAREYPNVHFAPGAREGLHHSGQMLLHHADAVACVSSSLGMQAVFFEKPLLALGSSHLTRYATWRSAEEFNRGTPATQDLTPAIAWMMRHYYMPGNLCRQGTRFAKHISALVEASTGRGLDRYPLFGTDQELLDALLAGASIKAA